MELTYADTQKQHTGNDIESGPRQIRKERFPKTSMRDIADAAGMGVGNVYNYLRARTNCFRR